MLLTGQVPCPLQTIDSGTAENIRYTQERVMGLVTGLWGLAPLFRYRVSLVAWPMAYMVYGLMARLFDFV